MVSNAKILRSPVNYLNFEAYFDIKYEFIDGEFLQWPEQHAFRSSE